MYVCNTKNNDVRNALKRMKDTMRMEEIHCLRDRNDAQEMPIILQVGMVKYRRLKTITSREQMIEEAKQNEAKHFINPSTLTLHERGCHHIADHFLKAVLVKPKLTGLVRCKHCMS